jgi:hypothetical protein
LDDLPASWLAKVESISPSQLFSQLKAPAKALGDPEQKHCQTEKLTGNSKASILVVVRNFSECEEEPWPKKSQAIPAKQALESWPQGI